MSLSGRPIPTSRNFDCPVCGGTDSSCRVLPDDTVFCHGLSSARVGEKCNGYICLKGSENGHTATFRPDNSEEWTLERKREWEAKKANRERIAREDERARREKALPTSDRHEFYSKIFDQLTLDPATVEDLKRRGFSDEEIERSGFKSVKAWQKLDSKFPDNLPGIGKGGNTLIVPGDGYISPARDVDGKIAGIQLRLNVPIDGNRYRWLSSTITPVATKEFDELPLAVYIPSCLKSFDIQLVEGTGVKPFLAAERMGMVTIGAAGGNHTSSPETLKHTISVLKEVLHHFATQSNTQTNQDSWLYQQIQDSLDNSPELSATVEGLEVNLVITPDAGFALNPSVIRTLLKTIEWLQKNFKDNKIYVLEWNQIHKSQGDIDELNDLSIIRKLKLASFAKKYKEVFDLTKGFANKRYQEWAKKRVTLTADIIQDEKWLTIPKGIEKECDILLIGKSLGGGKTEATIDFLKYLNIPSLWIGYRNTLLYNTVKRANNKGLDSLHVKDAIENVGGQHVNFAADASIKLWAGCADSFFKFNAIVNHNPEYAFIHDEICSVLGHLKGGGTLKGRQQQAIEWDVSTIRNSQFCIMMDANLCDDTVNFIRLLFPEKRIKVLDSHSPKNPRIFNFVETASENNDYTTTPKYLPSQLVNIAKGKDKVLWISDSQRSCEVVDEILTANKHKHFRLDGKTSHDEISKQFQSAPKEFIVTEKLDSVSLSPSGESGLSIDLYDYFDAVCFDIRGTVGVNTLTQLSARLRDTKVPIYVACPEFVNMTSDPCPYAINKVREVYNERLDMLLAKSMEVDEELVNSEFVMNMFTNMGEKFSKDPWFIESLKDAKQLKYEHSNLKLTLKTALAQAGHRVIDLVEACDESVHDEVKETKETVKKREAEKVFNSEDIDWDKAHELSKKDVNYDDKCKIRKARLKHKLPGIESTTSWNADLIYTLDIDQPQFLDKRWRLMQLQNEELAKAVFKSEKKYNFEFGFAPMDAWKSHSTKIEALKLLGVSKLIEADVFSTSDEWVKEIVDQYYRDPAWFNLIGIPRAKQTLKTDGTPKSLKYVKDMINRFLEYFGLETEQVSKSGSVRFFRVTTSQKFQELLPDIDACLVNRAKNTLQDAEKISLKTLSDKAEETQRQQQEWNERHQAELKKRMLEAQITHRDKLNCQSTDSFGTNSHHIYISQKEVCPNTDTQDIHNTEVSEWSQPETIADVAQLLEYCETAEMLSELRKCEIPADVFRIASRQLAYEKREQIRAWVLAVT